MEQMYQPERWHEVFVVLGTSGAAVAGLLLVAASVRADQIMTVPYWRMRARSSTAGMLGVMIGSILVLAPQEPEILGIELIVFNLLLACFLLRHSS
jgi:hypothetical protein